jgi:hypothetical protein
MSDTSTLPPGESPLDSADKDIDAVAFALQRVETYLIWIEEHRASFAAARDRGDAEEAERELGFLKDASHQAARCFRRLKELVLAGYGVDPTKRLPRDWR